MWQPKKPRAVALFTLVVLAVTVALGLYFEFVAQRPTEHFDVRAQGARPSDYRPLPNAEPVAPSPWVALEMAALRQCIEVEGRAGAIVPNPCRWSCTEVVGKDDDAHFHEAWFLTMPQEACDAQDVTTGER